MQLRLVVVLTGLLFTTSTSAQCVCLSVSDGQTLISQSTISSSEDNSGPVIDCKYTSNPVGSAPGAPIDCLYDDGPSPGSPLAGNDPTVCPPKISCLSSTE